MASSSSSSSSSISSMKYEVFISFRGKDIRFGFLSHIHKALVDNKIRTFVDDQLERGEEIESSLLETIESSAISVVLFSQNYAESPWCLDELVKILECKKATGQIVIPVFYLVKPDDVQDLTGSFGKAISEHKQHFDAWKVEKWIHALKETSFLSGFESQGDLSESKLVEKIIKDIQEKLNYLYRIDCSYDDGLVGIHSRVVDVKLLLQCEGVRVVGIWGPGGIGKTTIAQNVFRQICCEFESYCFVENVTEKFERCSDAIHNQLFSRLFGKDGFDIGNSIMTLPYIRRRLSQMKVLIVLDDVNDFDQIKSIIGTHVQYGSGSRIIVTSRDRQLLVNVDAKIYKVEKLNEREALQLFCFHAFRSNIPDKEFVELSERAVECAGGLPLALQVFGCNLRSKSAEHWADALENLKGTPNQKVHKILRRSYDGLSKDEKDIFLDIAHFFKGRNRDFVESILAKDLPDRTAKVSGSKCGIDSLVDKSLISITSTNNVDMHDLIQQMGREIECEVQKLKNRRRIWKPKEVIRLLTEKEGSDVTKGLSLDLSKIKDVILSPKAFKKMYNLKYLIFYYTSYSSEIRLHFPKGLEYLSEELRYLCWEGCSLKSLPNSFRAENLVELLMTFNDDLEELWDGVQNLANLKYMDVSWSKKLKRIPDLSRALNLEVLHLDQNESLVEIPSSLNHLTKLTDLSLCSCSHLSHLPSCLHLISLKSFNLIGCNMLTMIPNFPCYERHHGNAIEKVPSHMGCQFQHRDLDLYWCSRLESLSDNICSLIYPLESLSITMCPDVRELPKNLDNLIYLKELLANGSGINKLPDSLCNLKNLEYLHVGDCVNLCGLPQNLGNLKSLKKIYAYRSGIKELPVSINDLRELRTLDLHGCKGLKLPMWTAGSPLQVFMTGNFPHLGDVNLGYCEISEFPSSLCCVTSLYRLNLNGNNFESIPKYIKQLCSMNSLSFRNCKRLKYIPDSIAEVVGRWRGMKFLDFGNCNNLDQRQLDKVMHNIVCRGTGLGIPGSELPEKMMYHQINNESSLSYPFVPPKELNFLGLYGMGLGLCIPGSELPEKMMYQNNNGSSLSFSFGPLKDMDFRGFYVGAVCEVYADLYDVRYDIDIIESGYCIYSETNKPLSSLLKDEINAAALRSKHVLLKGWIFTENLIKGNEYYTFVLKFYAVEQTTQWCNSDAIIKCGFHPIHRE